MNLLKTIIILALAAATLLTCSEDQSSENPEDWVRKAVPVKVDTARTSTFVNTLSYNGSLLAIQTARIIPEMPGKIEGLYVQIGDFVKKGTPLVQMDVSTLKLQQKQAKAGAEVASANLMDAQKNWERAQTLRTENAVSQQQLEKMRLGLEAAQAQMQQASAGLDLLNMQLNKATLSAPFSGVITQRGFNQGDLFSPAAMMPVFTLQDVSRIKIELQITSQEINLIQKGQHAFLEVDYLENPIPGTVTLVGVAADPMSKTFFVECQFDNSKGELSAGTFGAVRIAIDEIENVMVVPKNSVIEKSHVFVVIDNHAYRRGVQVVRESQNEVVISSGLNENEIYVTKGAFILADSSLVQVEV
jgi:RND family efflux transporter MFP subunit